MTQRTIYTGTNPQIIIKAGGSVTVKGYESDRLAVETLDKRGLQVEQRSRSEFARARAAVGEHVLFDLHMKLPTWEGKKNQEELIEVQIRGSGEVLVPFDSDLKVYGGKDVVVQCIRGQVDAVSGHNLSLQSITALGHASAGRSMEVDCQSLAGDRLELKAGSDIRFHIHDLTSASFRVKDTGGYWEARLGEGEKSIYLKSGGDVTIVTDQKVEPLPPYFILGKVVRPDALAGAA